jgi:hypothetical protein
VLPVFTPDGIDREIFRFIGRAMGDGLLPYRDYFDHKPPFIYLVFAIFKFAGVWDIWISGTLFLALCVWLFASMNPSKVTWANILPVFILVIGLRNPAFYEYGGLTREYTAYWYVIFLFFYYRKNWLAQSLVIGIVLITQPNDVLPLIPFWVLGLKTIENRRVLNLIKSLLLIMLPLALISIWMAIIGSFQIFIEDVFVFNFKYYTSAGSLATMHFWKHGLEGIVYYLGIGILGPVLIMVLMVWGKNKVEAWTIILSLFLALVNLFLSGRNYGHYYLPVVSLLAFGIMQLLNSPSNPIRMRLVEFSCLLFFVGLVNANRQFSLHHQMELVKEQTTLKSSITNIIEKHKFAGGQRVFVNYTPGLQFINRYKTYPSSPYTYYSLWDEIPRWDPKLIAFKSHLKSFEKSGTLVFDFTIQHPFVRKEQNQYLQAHLKEGFQEIDSIYNSKQEVVAKVYEYKD